MGKLIIVSQLERILTVVLRRELRVARANAGGVAECPYFAWKRFPNRRIVLRR